MIVYCATNIVTGKRYVGITSKSLAVRVREHLQICRKSIFSCAIRAYGPEKFVFEQIDSAETKESLFVKEQQWIGALRTQHPNGYNQTAGGGGIINPSAEVRLANSIAHRGKKASLETRAKMSRARLGKRMPSWFSELTRQRMLGRKLSDETRKKIGDLQRGKKRGPYSEEHRRRISEGQKGRIISPEQRAAISLKLTGNIPWNKGKQMTDEHRRNLSLAHKGNRPSAETRAKMSRAHMGHPNYNKLEIVRNEKGQIAGFTRRVR